MPMSSVQSSATLERHRDFSVSLGFSRAILLSMNRYRLFTLCGLGHRITGRPLCLTVKSIALNGLIVNFIFNNV